MLSSLLRVVPKSPCAAPDTEDIFQSSLGLIFTDDLQNQHGDAQNHVRYRSNGYGDLDFQLADPQAEKDRSKFAHYLWNAGVLMAELVGGRRMEGRMEGGGHEDWGKRRFAEGREWWIDGEEKRAWEMEGERVLELGAGVGLVGIMSALAGAAEATISDYPAPSIIDTLKVNVAQNMPASLRSRVQVEPHLWGDVDSTFAHSHKGYYSRVLAADTLWLPSEHDSLAQSMVHFLSDEPSTRVHVIAGFHTGRGNVSSFFRETVPGAGLTIEDIFEMDADGRRREWNADAPEEPHGERNKWLVVARLKKQ